MSLDVMNKESANEEASYFRGEIKKNTRLLSFQNPFLELHDNNSEMMIAPESPLTPMNQHHGDGYFDYNF